MLYNHFQDLELSALGLGTMRLPVIDGDNSKIDMEQAAKMVAHAFASGINYIDTAWFYHDHNAEIAMGQILKAYPRDSFYLASKFPGKDPEKGLGVADIFEKQLEKCQVDYFDFYLFHNLWEKNIDEHLSQEVVEYLLQQKKEGRIRHLGVSTHGKLETIKRFLDAVGEHLEFIQLQVNWLDWTLQQAKEKIEMAKSYGLPVWVMEPVRGGRLANVPEKYAAPLRKMHPDWTDPEWAFRFLQTIPEVTMVLSGMSNMTQLQQNIDTFSEKHPLSEEELAALQEVAASMTLTNTLYCTGCRYCTSHCPQEIDIPGFVKQYNKRIFNITSEDAAPEGNTPADCVACHACESACPQNIKIAEMMAELAGK